ncbi:DNA ligase/mRNA capping enzyme [Aureobasidium subglaciale]|nr:DNA ligase/mRNA capping enzyme [Aureobasidium subglaciale]
MSFKFAYLSDYLERCEDIITRDPPLAPAEQKSRLYRQHATWFASHRKDIDSLDELGTSALLSTFLPCRRKDRIYGLQPTSLLKLLGRCLGLSASARHELASFRTPNNGDLGDCLQRLLQVRGPPPLPAVTLQECDDALHALAACNRFSAPSIRQSFHSSAANDSSLAGVLLRLHPVEAKWFVRLILKDFTSVSLNERSVLASVHFLLPDLLDMQDSFENACLALKTTFAAYPSRPDHQSTHILRQTAISSLRPVPGVKVGRPEYTKARSIKHCLQMTAGKKWLLERKYDGEYCQIHIDLTKGDDWLKIYSKSGRDSTEDRAGLHQTIQKCLRIGSDKCRFKRACILVGEMVVFSDTENCIVGFDKIRKHVSRAGTFLGAENDTPRQPDEHLMIILFDLLLLDDEAMLSQSVEERKARLSSIYKKIHGRAAPAESCVVDFSQAKAKHKLMNQLAASIACRHEGLVLKPCGVPYFTHDSVVGIKLKKDYITGLGDEADFAVVGASYNAQEAKKRSGLRLKFTHFHLGCLLNKGAIHQDGIKPVIKIVATIAFDQCMSTAILERVNIEGSLLAEPYNESTSMFTIESDKSLPVESYFRDPLVFEVLGSSYSKVPGGYFMLRHPRVRKLHQDRTWRDCITFDGLQSAAAEALDTPQHSETQENINWMTKLETNHKRRYARHSLNTTPRSSNADTTPRSARSDFTYTPSTSSTSRLKPLAVLENGLPLKTTRAIAIIQNEMLPTPPETSPLARHGATASSPALCKRKPSEDQDKDNRPKKLRIQTLSTLEHQEQAVEHRFTSSPRRPLKDITREVARKSVGSIMSSAEAYRPNWIEGSCKFEQATPPARRDGCIFSQAVVFIAGLNTAQKDEVQQRLLEHGALVIQDLAHWNRDSHGYEQGSDTVCESQAYKGQRKMVLVDPRETRQYRACYAEVEKLGLHRVEIFDYRVVKAMCSNAEMG